MGEKVTALDTALRELEEASRIAGLDPRVVEFLREPQRVFIARFPVRMDDGSVRFFTGYRVHHCHALGPIRGGTRFHPEETLDDVKALALWMTIKNALNEIPAGGGKGGVVCDPAQLTLGELERVCRGYIRAIAPMIGSWVDFPGADIGTDARTQSWMLDEWEQMHAMQHEPTAISGKDIVIGGSKGRPQATGMGLRYAVREAAKVLGLELSGLKVAVQGFGKVGSWVSRLLYDDGATIVAVSDVYGGIYNPGGFNPYEVLEHVEKNGSVCGFPGAQAISNAELMALDCDVLIPAAVQSVLTEANAAQVRARLIVEGANGPTTPEAEQIMLSRGIFIVPDILANGGGTSVAHLERVQGLYDFYWSEDEVYKHYDAIFTRIFAEVYAIAQEEKLSMRMAAWVKALRKVEQAIKVRGWV